MSLSSLPPELLLQIIESSVPRDFHSTTYSDRQLTLCALSLVSKSFGAIAQPLLLDFVFIQSSPLLNNVLDQLARQSSIRVPRIFVIFLCRSETEPVAVKRLPELVPSLPALALNLEKSSKLNLSFLSRFSNLTTLHLSSPNFSLPPSIVLPALKALSLCDVGLNLILDLLSPSNLPSLQALALLYGSDDEADALQTTNISGLTEQLESLYLRIDTWKDVEPQKRLLLTKRTLVDCSYWELETAAQDALVVTNLRIFGVGDAAVAQAYTDEIFTNLQSFTNSIKLAPTLHLRLLYLDVELLTDEEIPPRIRDALEELAAACEEKKVEVEWLTFPTEINTDSFILPNFWQRQRRSKEKRDGESKGE